MKKIVSISLLIIYLALAVGISVDVHYCFGRVSNVNLSIGTGIGCDKCLPTEVAYSCCSNETVTYQISDEHSQSLNYQLPNTNFFLIKEVSYFYTEKKAILQNLTFSKNHPPPIHPELYLLHSSFTFYG